MLLLWAEQREPPVKTFLKGRFNNGLTDVDCLIRNLSETGARLSLSGGISVPAVIDLLIPLKRQTLRAKVNWRNGDEMRVSFIKDLQAGAAPVARPNSKLAERVAKLETESASLSKMLMQLESEIFPNQDLGEVAYRRSSL